MGRHLRGVDDRDARVDSMGSEILPDDPRERVLARRADIGDLHPRRVHLGSRAHGRKDLELALVAVSEELGLGGDVVDCVNDPVGAFEEGVSLGRVAPEGDRGFNAGQSRSEMDSQQSIRNIELT